MSDLDRIRWHCRRGLLELDLVLGAFLDAHLERLTAEELVLFEELLEYGDNDLLDLAMGRAELTDPRCAPVLQKMRATLLGLPQRGGKVINA